ncbi:MAG: 50S ribosomal protein L23 [Bacteroidetes bacterium]|nr:50S ribosomal protein L23 [Bacteroidota bacterium]
MSIYLKPIITEKFSAMANQGRYAFVVEKTANKLEIKNAIEKGYGVTVESVNTINYGGKIKMRYTKTKIMSGIVKRAKKAIVTLKKGDTIDFYGNI